LRCRPLRGFIHRDKVIGRGDFSEQRPFAVKRGIVVNLLGFQFDHIAITLEYAIGQQAAQVFKVDTATVDARVVGFGHFLNIAGADNAPVAGITLDADAKEL
jgi:hypothetical protein